MRYRIEAIGLDIGPNTAFRDASGASYGPDWTSKVGPEHMAAIGMVAYEPEPTPPAPVPIPDLSPRQLWLGLMTEEIITPAECEAAGNNIIPAFIEAVIADLPSEVQRAAARVTINKGLTIERNNYLVAEALSRLPIPPPPEAVDAFFLTYSQV